MANKYRELLARAIEQNQGYSRSYHERFALAFTVGLWCADLSLESIYTIAAKEFGTLPPLSPAVEWSPDNEWERGVQCMVASLEDGDSYRTYSPDTANRYGLPYHSRPWLKYWRRRKAGDTAYYPAKVSGWVIVNPYCNETYRVGFGLYGRGGKHLCIESFEGVGLDMCSDDLAEAIRNDDGGNYSNKWCQRLLAMIAEWDQCFTSKNASAELEYQCADSLYRQMEDRAALKQLTQ